MKTIELYHNKEFNIRRKSPNPIQKCRVYTKRPHKKGVFVLRQQKIENFSPMKDEFQNVQNQYFNHVHDDEREMKLVPIEKVKKFYRRMKQTYFAPFNQLARKSFKSYQEEFNRAKKYKIVANVCSNFDTTNNTFDAFVKDNFSYCEFKEDLTPQENLYSKDELEKILEVREKFVKSKTGQELQDYTAEEPGLYYNFGKKYINDTKNDHQIDNTKFALEDLKFNYTLLYLDLDFDARKQLATKLINTEAIKRSRELRFLYQGPVESNQQETQTTTFIKIFKDEYHEQVKNLIDKAREFEENIFKSAQFEEILFNYSDVSNIIKLQEEDNSDKPITIANAIDFYNITKQIIRYGVLQNEITPDFVKIGAQTFNIKTRFDDFMKIIDSDNKEYVQKLFESKTQ